MVDHRGRGAERPADIPAKGWKDIFWRVVSEISDDRVMLVAAGVTFYTLLALVPGISALISIYGLFADPATISKHISILKGFLPGGALDIITEQVERIAKQQTSTLGLAFIAGLGIALWSANAGMKSLFEAMNVAYDEKEERNFFVLNAVTLTFTIMAVIFAVIVLGLVVAMPALLKFIGLGESLKWLIRIGSYVLFAVIAMTAIAAVYRWGPSRDDPQWKWITPGAVVATLVWIIVSLLFSWYVSNFGSYNATYGSLGALIGFMTWIWISVNVIVVGAELNSEAEHQTRKDTTTGPREPMGERDAVMADTLGETKS